jgi:hypothetical protein
MRAGISRMAAKGKNSTLKKPNLFIVGAPRSGTTSLWSYLKDHPDIFMSAEKELYFFDSDLWAREAWAPTLEQYLANFSAATDEGIIGEATPSYLRSKRAPAEIKCFNPEARIIIMLRNPLDVMHSLHSQGLRYGTEPIGDFEAALQADTARVGRESLGYHAFTDFPNQVQRYFDVFGREHVHTIIFDDLKDNPASVYQDTLRFLNVGLNFAPGFKMANANLQVRNARLQRILVHRPRAFRGISRALLPKWLRTRVSRALLSSNVVSKARPPMDPELRRRLQRKFEPTVQQLGKLLDRDLSGWVQGSNGEYAEIQGYKRDLMVPVSNLRR